MSLNRNSEIDHLSFACRLGMPTALALPRFQMGYALHGEGYFTCPLAAGYAISALCGHMWFPKAPEKT